MSAASDSRHDTADTVTLVVPSITLDAPQSHDGPSSAPTAASHPAAEANRRDGHSMDAAQPSSPPPPKGGVDRHNDEHAADGDGDDDGDASADPTETLPRSGLARLLTALDFNILPFEDREQETAFLGYIYSTNLVPQVIILAVMGAINVILVPVISVAFPSTIVSNSLMQGSALCGVAAWLLSLLALVAHVKNFWNTPRHIEKWWAAMAIAWVTPTMLTFIRRSDLYCNGTPGFFTSMTNVTDPRTVAACRERIIDGFDLSALGTLNIGAPRVSVGVTGLIVYNVLVHFTARWIWDRRVSIVRHEGMLIWICAYTFVLFAFKERAQRKRFLGHLAFVEKIRSAAKARQAVETIMANILPIEVLGKLIRQEPVIDSVPQASVLFSDIAGFTSWSSSRTAIEIVKMLNCMYRNVDNDLTAFGIQKITTIGDAYWAACGIPSNTDMPATRMSAFGLQMQRHVAEMRRQVSAFADVRIRVGVATGFVSGGIVGTRQLAYQIFGPVNELAEHLEQLAPVGGVLICDATYECLQRDCSPASDVRVTAGPASGHSFVLHELPWKPAALNLGVSGGDLSPSGSVAMSGRQSLSNSNALASGRSSASGVDTNDARDFLLGPRARKKGKKGNDNQTAVTGVTAMEAEGVDLEAQREQLSTRAHTLRLTFANAAVEKAYQGFVAQWYRGLDVGGLMSFLSASFHAIVLFWMLDESVSGPIPDYGVIREPWFAFVAFGVLFVLAMLNGCLSRRLPPVMTWLRCVALDQIVMHVIAIFLSPLSGLRRELFYLISVSGFSVAVIGSPNLSWVVGALVSLVCMMGTHYAVVVTQSKITASYVPISLAGWLTCVLAGNRNNEREMRSQFLDDHVAVLAEEEISEQRQDIEKLLAKSVPAFVLPELSLWLGSDRTKAISHQHDMVAILFLRVPFVAESLHDPHVDPVEALRAAAMLVALYDEVITGEAGSAALSRAPSLHPGGGADMSSGGMQLEPQRTLTVDSSSAARLRPSSSVGSYANPAITKIKTIGDIILVAAGLHRYDPKKKPASHRRRKASHVPVSARSTTGGGGGGNVGGGGAASSLSTTAAGNQLTPQQDPSHGRRRSGEGASALRRRSAVPEESTLTGAELRDAQDDALTLVALAWRIQRHVAEHLPGAVAVGGIHCGPVAAGVLGDERLVYDVFGDTVNTSSRIMSAAASVLQDGGHAPPPQATPSAATTSPHPATAAVAAITAGRIFVSDSAIELVRGALERQLRSDASASVFGSVKTETIVPPGPGIAASSTSTLNNNDNSHSNSGVNLAVDASAEQPRSPVTPYEVTNSGATFGHHHAAAKHIITFGLPIQRTMKGKGLVQMTPVDNVFVDMGDGDGGAAALENKNSIPMTD